MEPNIDDNEERNIPNNKEDVNKETNSGKSLALEAADILSNNSSKINEQTNYNQNSAIGNNSTNTLTGVTAIINTAIKNEKEKITNYIYDFKPNTKKLFNYEDKELEDYTNLLLNENILIIDSNDYNILLCGLSNMFSLTELKHTSQKRFNFDKGNFTRKDILFRNIIDEFIETNNNISLVVFTNESDESTNFFSQFLSNDFKSSIEAYRANLKDKNSFIVIAVSDSKSIEELNNCDVTQYIPRYKLSFVKYRLSNYFSIEEITLLFNRIEEQRKAGKWSENDEDFYKEINRCLQVGGQMFKQNILEKGNGKEDFAYNNLVIKEQEDSQKLISDKDELIRYIAYIAINFTNITLSEFRYIAQILLDDTEKKEFITNPLKEDEKIESKLLYRWNNTADIIMRKLQLKEVFSEKDNSKIIVYENTGFADVFKEEFLTTWSWFSQQQFTYLYFTAGLLFLTDAPYRIVERFVKIAAEVAMNDPDLYTEKLLFFTTFSIINQEAKINFKIDPNEDNLEQAFEEFLSQVKEKHFELKLRQLDAIRKIVLLVEEMMNYDNLRNRINNFFNLLINNGLQDTVLFFTYSLRTNKSFDALYWIKQLLERSPFKTKKDCYSLLIAILSEDTSPHIFKTLDKIQKWFIDKPIPSSDSANAGICVIIDYLFKQLQKVTTEDYGTFPVKFHLFANIDDKNIVIQKLEMIGSWLLKTELQEAYITLDSFFERRADVEFNEVILAQLIILLKIILTGTGKMENYELLSANAIQLGEVFTETIYKNSTKIQKKELKLGFKNWRDYYAQRMRTEQLKKRRETFQSLSKTAGGLLNYFNQQNHTIL